jgi:uncharacterized repeat protein (TIGR01451 family)
MFANMYKSIIAALSLASIAIASPILTEAPALAQLQPGTQAPAAQKMVVSLKQEKKVVENGKPKYIAVSRVKSGDVIRYTATGKANSDIKGMKLTVPIPKGTKYVMNSATPVAGAELLFSIDGGKNYSAKPMLNPKKEAPASTYTHVRWKFNGTMPAKSVVTAACDAEVR